MDAPVILSTHTQGHIFPGHYIEKQMIHLQKQQICRAKGKL